MKLRTKLILILIPLIIIQLIVLSSFFYNHLKATAKEMTFAQMKRAIEEVEFHVQSDLKLAAANIDLFSSSELVKRYMLADEETRYSLLQPSILKLFASYSDSYPNYYEIRILLPDGTEDTRFVSSQISNVNENEANSLYFKEMSTSNQSIYTNIFQNPDNNKIAFLISRKLVFSDPITDPTGVKPELKGYLVITMQPAFIEQQLAKLRIGKGGWIFFTDNNGKIVISLYKNELGKNLPENLFKKLTSYNLPKTMLRTIYKEQMSFMEVKKIHSKLFLFAVLPEEELLYEIKTLQIKVGSIAIAGILLTMLLFFFALDIFLINPIHKVAQAARKIGKGNLDINIVSNSNDEIGSLATEFNSMAQSLKDLYNNLEKIVEERTNDLKKTNEELLIAKEISDAAAKAKSEFLANMSHELRTPMNAIIGFSELTINTELTNKQRQYLNNIKTSSQLLLGIINDVLDFSKIDTGKLELENKTFNLHDITNNIFSMFNSKAKDKGLKFNLSIDNNIPTQLIGDSLRIEQILINICGNAIKFTEEGEIVVKADLIEKTEDSVYLKFSVKDTGIGIPTEKIPTLFKSFSQADGSSTRKYGGTGLGLAVSKRLAEMMGGKLYLETEENKGTTFYFDIKTGYDKNAKPVLNDEQNNNIDIIKKIEGIKVLLVEDNDINQEIASEILQSIGINVQIAENGEISVRKLMEEDFDIVLMDVQMPVMDGYTATKAIRSNPKYKDIPIIAMTANALKGDREKCLDAGMNDYIIKPIEPDELFNSLAKWIKSKQREKGVNKPARDISNAVDLPENLPGIDVEAGLKRLGGNKKIFKDVLKIFKQQYANIHDRIVEELDRGNINGAEQLAHMVKGVAGNCAAKKLQLAATELDDLLKGDDMESFANISNILDKFSLALTEVLTSIDTIP
ncbi:MAG: response regulator [Desulfobacterales bacterium]|nr:response regulator [Desulfobacterales bacterium]